jgi:hypothetical protein
VAPVKDPFSWPNNSERIDSRGSDGAQLGLPPASVAKIEEVRKFGLHSLKLLQAGGVRMGFGTDLLGPSHRLRSDEFVIRRQVLRCTLKATMARSKPNTSGW